MYGAFDECSRTRGIGIGGGGGGSFDVLCHGHVNEVAREGVLDGGGKTILDSQEIHLDRVGS